LDPAWHGASNELIYLNSLKMKMSVILGVVQMSAGLALRWGNAWHEGSGIDLACECLPMTVFMICFFGFMDFMIMYKWVTPMADPPSIINAMISMGMFQTDPNPMFGLALPFWLMVASVLVVPVMLFPKPLLLLAKHNAQQARSRGLGPNGGDMEAPLVEKHGHGEGFDFGDVFIHQIIETIEYVLGTVSHTASYLRLWALSLAHQQLSLVFFQKTLLFAMTLSFPVNVLAMVVLFAFWFAATVGILLGMDVMECFLHTLRLHWVEFQSKFYRADGHGFAPYSHRQLLIKSYD
jgi:V-type H+-transporting ATPase subunit a